MFCSFSFRREPPVLVKFNWRFSGFGGVGRGEFELKVFQVSKSFGSSSNKLIQIQELLGLIQKLGLISCTHPWGIFKYLNFMLFASK
jgi:hypothetical protein